MAMAKDAILKANNNFNGKRLAKVIE